MCFCYFVHPPYCILFDRHLSLCVYVWEPVCQLQSRVRTYFFALGYLDFTKFNRQVVLIRIGQNCLRQIGDEGVITFTGSLNQPPSSYWLLTCCRKESKKDLRVTGKITKVIKETLYEGLHVCKLTKKYFSNEANDFIIVTKSSRSYYCMKIK